MIDVLDHFCIGEPVDWVGSTMGEHVGIPFALAYPGELAQPGTIASLVQGLTNPMLHPALSLLGPLTGRHARLFVIAVA
jgi:hypothetical protein